MGRLEIANVRSSRGIAKILGTGVSLAGVTMMTLYKGPALKNMGHALVHIRGSTTVVQQSWLKGSLLTVASCITWSIFYIMQVLVQNLIWIDNSISLVPFVGESGIDNKSVFFVLTGIYSETISSTAFANCMDEFCRSSTVCCIYNHCAA